MKGLVLVEKGKTEWREVPKPEMGAFDVAIKPTVVAPCTTDLHLIETFAMPFLAGRVIGHETSGIVQEVGSLVKDFKPGDRVVAPSGMFDWRNLNCQIGLYKSAGLGPYRPNSKNGGCFSDLFVIKDADMNLAHVPDSVTLEQAVIISDMATTGFEAVEQLNIKYGDNVAVIGVGAVGLMAVCAAVMKGAARIYAVGSRQVCFDIAKEYGATDFIDYRKVNFAEEVLKRNGKPLDAVTICGGTSSNLVGEELSMIAEGRTVTSVTGYFEDETTVIPNSVWRYGCLDKTFRTVMCMGGRMYTERLLSLVENKRFLPEKIITHTFHGQEKVQEALMQMGGNNRSMIKPIVYFD